MKNPGWANNRGSPPYISRNSSYQIPLSANAPAAMILKPKTACGDEDGSQSAACVQISTFLSRCLHLATPNKPWNLRIRHSFHGGRGGGLTALIPRFGNLSLRHSPLTENWTDAQM